MLIPINHGSNASNDLSISDDRVRPFHSHTSYMIMHHVTEQSLSQTGFMSMKNNQLFSGLPRNQILIPYAFWDSQRGFLLGFAGFNHVTIDRNLKEMFPTACGTHAVKT